MSRLADRYSLLFLAVTVALATAAWWFTGDPIRAVAVLVVATPCPLILAVPVALVAGLSRAAHFGVLIKGAKPLEALARIRTLILDKTGTLTDGRPQIVSIDAQGGMSEDEVLRFAAALDQASKHPIAQAIVAAARARGLALPVPEDVVETPGEGVVGTIEGRRVVVGGADFVAAQVGAADAGRAARGAGSVVVALAVDGKLAGHLVMADALRSGTAELLAGLRRLGHRAHPAGDRRPARRGRGRDRGAGARRRAGRPDARPEGAAGPDRAQERPGDDGGRRRERRAGARRRRYRRRHGRARGGGLGRGGGCRAAGRSARPPAAGDRDRPARPAGSRSRASSAGIGLSVARDDRRRLRLPDARCRARSCRS